jgi:hypothetical protein
VRSRAAVAGVAVGFVAVLAVWLPAQLGRTLLAWPWYAPLGTCVTVAVGLAADRGIPKHEIRNSKQSPIPNPK